MDRKHIAIGDAEMMMCLIYWINQQIMALLFTIMSFVSCLTGGRLFFRIKVFGRENIGRARRPVILIPNHKTFADHFFLAAALLFNFRILPARIMATDWIYSVRWWKGGFLLRWLLGALGAFQERGGLGLRTALHTLRAGQSVAIYPEGVANRGSGIADIQKGVVWLARKTGVPLLPCGLRGLEHSSAKDFFGGRMVTVILGSPFHIGPNEDMDSALLKIKNKLEELYNENA